MPKFIYRSDAGLGSVHPGIQPYGRAGLYRNPVDQKKTQEREKVWALDPRGANRSPMTNLSISQTAGR